VCTTIKTGNHHLIQEMNRSLSSALERERCQITSELIHLISALVSDRGAILLNGESSRLHAVNRIKLSLETETARKTYLRVFCEFVRGGEGPLRIIGSVDDIPFSDEGALETLRSADEAIGPPEAVQSDTNGPPYRFKACVLYGDALFIADFMMPEDGVVQMLDDDQIATDLPILRRTFKNEFRTPLGD
jgi:hypothetical protein